MSDFDLLGSLGSLGPAHTANLRATPAGPEAPQCSRKGCRKDAAWALIWNNPKVHTPERRKTWLACEEHRGWLTDYLSTRAFFREALPVAQLGSGGSATQAEPASGPASPSIDGGPTPCAPTPSFPTTPPTEG